MIPQYSPDDPYARPKPVHRPGWIYEEKVDGWRIAGPYRGGPTTWWLTVAAGEGGAVSQPATTH